MLCASSINVLKTNTLHRVCNQQFYVASKQSLEAKSDGVPFMLFTVYFACSSKKMTCENDEQVVNDQTKTGPYLHPSSHSHENEFSNGLQLP